MIDCTTYRVTNIVPLRGQVLIEILEPPTSRGGIHFPQTHAHYIDEAAKPSIDVPTHQEGIVRKIGAETKCDFGLGDRVIMRRGAGRTVRQPPRLLKVLLAKECQAVFV